jgi:capsular exopolysaccharide synthesis family protein
MVTSAIEGEGKTTTTLNLAVSLARETGERVLLVDCDLRRGMAHRSMGLPDGPGLSDYLDGEVEDADSLCRRTTEDRLAVMPAGRRPLSSTRLLGSLRMKELMVHFRGRYDRILLDAPPVLNLADVPVLAPQADGVILVVRMGSTRRELVQNAQTILESIPRVHLMGYVVSQVEQHIPSYLYMYMAEIPA